MLGLGAETTWRPHGDGAQRRLETISSSFGAVRLLAYAPIAVIVIGLTGCAEDEAITVTATTTATVTHGETGETVGREDPCTSERGDPLPETEEGGECTDEDGNLVIVAPAGEWARGPDLAVRLVGRRSLASSGLAEDDYVAYTIFLENVTTDPMFPYLTYGFYLETAEGVRHRQDSDAIVTMDDNVGYITINPGEVAEASVIYKLPAAQADGFPDSGAGVRVIPNTAPPPAEVSGDPWQLYLRI